MKKQVIYGFHPIKTALIVKKNKITQIFLQKSRKDERLQTIVDLAKEIPIKIDYVAKEDLTKMVSHDQHQGMVAVSETAINYNEALLPELISSFERPRLLLVIDGVQDPHNLGACLRCASAMNVQAVIVPKDRAVGLTPTVRKVACGAAEVIPFIQVTNLARTVRLLKENGIWVIGTASEANLNISNVDLTGDIAIAMGSEHKGLRRLIRKESDFVVKIPMRGVIESLNVSVATGICLYECLRQRELFADKGKITS